MTTDPEKNKELCNACSMCCNYVTVEINEPKTKDDFINLIWLILHEKVMIYQDPEGIWNMEVETPCKALTKEGLCGIYEERPEICKEYKQEDCDKYSKKPFFIVLFKTREDILEYIKKYTQIKME